MGVRGPRAACGHTDASGCRRQRNDFLSGLVGARGVGSASWVTRMAAASAALGAGPSSPGFTASA